MLNIIEPLLNICTNCMYAYNTPSVKMISKSIYMTHLLEWPKSRTLTTPSTNEGVKQQKLSFIAGGNAEWYSCYGRQLGISSRNQAYSHHIIHKLCQLCICPNELKTHFHTKTSPHLLSIEALLIIAKTRNQPKCSSGSKWINNCCTSRQ